MSETGSQRSGDASETSSQAADRAILKRRNRGRDADGDEDDLLEQKKSLQEGVFAAMYMLARSKSNDSWAFVTVKIVLEGLIPFLVIFNPTNDWEIDTSNPVWQVARWALPRSPVARIWGYGLYVKVFYAVVATIYVVVFCIALLTIAMRRQEHSKALHRFARLLQLFTEVVFTLGYMIIFDGMMFLFNCKFISKDGHHPHNYFPDVECFETPHLIHLAVAAVTAIVFFCTTALMLVAGCDLNPVARGIMASPAAVTRLKILVLKAVYVIVVNTLGSIAKVQAVVMTVAAGGITYFNFARLPFLRHYINYAWVGDWTAVTYACVVYCLLEFSGRRDERDYNYDMVMVVLYGVFPVYGLGALATFLWYRYRMRPTNKFRNLPQGTKLKKVYDFGSPEEVELLARNMRHFDVDGVITEDAAHLGQTIIKCGMAVFTNHVELFILYANFLMEVWRDGPASRTQLQLALKGGPSIVQRYGIFSTIENSKRLKDGQEGTLDLQSYVEFKRNYRAVIRVHKAALAAQREFWQLMQRGSVRVSAITTMMRAMDETADTAHQVYRRVLERYPHNGKLLRCYGKFLEDVRNDPLEATRAYAEAARNGGADGLLSLDLQIQGTDKPEFLTTLDLHEDACIVINAEGTILMVNSCVTSLLGYPKMELEGANVSTIMPQPFSGRHPSYLSRYVQGGEPHILDAVRDVVALHKERHVFPVQICVTKLSGVGTDAIFLGVLRPQPMDARHVRVWVTPNGTILCTDPQFASLTGMAMEQMVGCNFQNLCADIAAAEALLEVCRDAPYDALVSGTIVRDVSILHKHLPPVPVEIKVTQGGTDGQRIFVFNAHRTDNNKDGLLVVDTKGSLTFATWDVAAMLGYPLKRFLRMKLEQLLPQPFGTMHNKHLKDHPVVVPPTSCRAGRVVYFLNSNGAQVPVRLQISSQDDVTTGLAKHIVQVRKVDPSVDNIHADKRLVLLCAMDGRILSVDHPESTLFGFTASAIVGSNLADCIDVFSEWRVKAGAHQLELLLLSLLDREVEMPGTSWRVKLHNPVDDDETLSTVPRISTGGGGRISTGGGASRHASGRSACLQTELVETGDMFGDKREEGGVEQGLREQEAMDTTVTLARIVLWRRDLLTGVVELDERLVIRKADVSTGLIVGLPPSTLPRMPLSRLLDVPKGATWDDMMKDKRKKSALKAGAGMTVSPVHAFEGSHPDGGTMRIFLQGVSGAGSSRIHATLHPDTGFTGARANIYRALGLEVLLHRAPAHAQGQAVGPHTSGAGGHVSGAGTITGDRTGGGIGVDGGRAQGPGGGGGVSGPQLKPSSFLAPAGKAQATAAQPGPTAATTAAVAVGGPGMASTQPSKQPPPQKQEQGQGQGEQSQPQLQLPGGREVGADRDAAAAAEEEEEGDDDEWPERDRASEARGVGEEEEEKASASSSNDDDGSDDDPAGGLGVRRSRRGSGGDGGDGDSDGGGEEEEKEEAVDPDHLHKTAHNQSEFVAQWVRTLAKQMTGTDPDAERDALPPSRPVSRALSFAPSVARSRGGAEGVEGREEEGDGERRRNGTGGSSVRRAVSGGGSGGGGGMAGRASMVARGSRKKIELETVQEEGESLSRTGTVASGKGAGGGGGGSPHGGGALADEDGDGDEEREDEEEEETTGKLMAMAAARGGPGSGSPRKGSRGGSSDNDGTSSVADDEEGTSQGLGPAMSDMSSAVDVDLATDARRARLLKRLFKIFTGPQLVGPLTRMRFHTLALLAAMLVTHVVIYVIFIALINKQFTNISAVHRLALAADRCQLVTVKTVALEFCSREETTERVSICENSLDSMLVDLRSALDDLEAYHQNTYLGLKPVPTKIKEPTAYHLWTSHVYDYRVYLDTDPPMWANSTTGVWQLGNRFVATARELLFLGAVLKGRIADNRTYKFVVANGPWSLFQGYTSSLEYLVSYAWREVEKLQTALIIMLVIEAGGIQLACILYELYLVRQVEIVRCGSLLAGLGIPGPMLRVLANKPVVVVEDSDDEEAEDEDGAGGEGGKPAPEEEDMREFMAGAEVRPGVGAAGLASVAAPGAAAACPRPPPPLAQPHYRRMSIDMAPPPPGAALSAQQLYGGTVVAPYYEPSEASEGSHPLRRHSGAGVGAGSERARSVAGGSVSGVVIGARRGLGLQYSPAGRVQINDKELVPSYRNTFKFMIPLFLWEVALVVVGAVSFVRLSGMQGPLASLNMASHVIYRYTRIRAMALLLVTSSSPFDRQFFRDNLKLELTNLESEYDTLMYGGLAVTQAGSVFQRPVPASTFESSSFSSNFFREERCFRWDQSKCYTPDSPYYEVTHHGLDVMLRRIISEMTLLASDDDADATYTGTRYTTMYMVGTMDLYEGLQSSAQLFVDFSISRYNSIKLLQTILLVVTIAFLLLYAVVLLRPYSTAVEKEATRLAGLMSHVPAEMDVAAHVRQVLRSYSRLQRKGEKARRGRVSDTGGTTDRTALLQENAPPSGKV